jgi:hypothetical protein
MELLLWVYLSPPTRPFAYCAGASAARRAFILWRHLLEVAEAAVVLGRQLLPAVAGEG